MAWTRNAEGYYDPTAYLAMRNIEQSERRKTMSFKRGDVYYVEKSVFTRGEQGGGRPAIIVSNNKYNVALMTSLDLSKPKAKKIINEVSAGKEESCTSRAAIETLKEELKKARAVSMENEAKYRVLQEMYNELLLSHKVPANV